MKLLWVNPLWECRLRWAIFGIARFFFLHHHSHPSLSVSSSIWVFYSTYIASQKDYEWLVGETIYQSCVWISRTRRDEKKEEVPLLLLLASLKMLRLLVTRITAPRFNEQSLFSFQERRDTDAWKKKNDIKLKMGSSPWYMMAIYISSLT